MGDSKVKVAVRVRPMNRRGETLPLPQHPPALSFPGAARAGGAGPWGQVSVGTGVPPVRVNRCVSVCA